MNSESGTANSSGLRQVPRGDDRRRRDGERFANRLEKFSQGRVEIDRSEVVDFWSRIMADHVLREANKFSDELKRVS